MRQALVYLGLSLSFTFFSQEEHQSRGCSWRLLQAEDERFVKEPFRCHGRERSPRPGRTRHLLIQHHHGCAQVRDPSCYSIPQQTQSGMFQANAERRFFSFTAQFHRAN